MSTSTQRWILIGLCAASFAACGKKSEQGQQGKPPGGSAAGSGAPAMPAELTAWTPTGASEVWQGAWASHLTLRTIGTMTMVGDPAAMEITGTLVRVFDGTIEHDVALAIDSPCTATFTKPITEGFLRGGTTAHTKQFLIEGRKLLAGQGAVGYRKGKAAIVCMTGPDKLVTLDDQGTCKAWRPMPDRWASKATTCAWSTVDGKEVLTVGSGDGASTLVARDELLRSEQFSASVKGRAHVRAASYDEAKGVVTAEIAANAKAP